MTESRRVINVDPVLVAIIVTTVAVAGCAMWFTVVPNDGERSYQCPRQEQIAESFASEEIVRPLRGYEKRAQESAQKYVERWCL